MKHLSMDHLNHAHQVERAQRLREDFMTRAYAGKNGELHWNSNNAVIGLDVFRDACVEPPASQKDEYDIYVGKSLAAYRESQKNYQPSEEELYEMRSAFGDGAVVVNVITGKKTQL